MRITLYLLRLGTEPSAALLRNGDRFVAVELQAPRDDAVSWQLYTSAGVTLPVSWLESVQTITTNPSSVALFRRSAGAVLLVKVDDRTFAVTFGTGFHAVDPSIIEADFGLLVAANSIDPDRMNLAEARGLGKGARNAVSSLPVPTGCSRSAWRPTRSGSGGSVGAAWTTSSPSPRPVRTRCD